MERFEFTTAAGSLIFAKGSPFVFASADGLGTGGVRRQTTEYADMDGADYNAPLYDPRLITLRGFIHAGSDADLYHRRRQLIRIINGKDAGILTYSNGYKDFFADAVPDMPEWGEKMQYVQPFTLYFNVPGFYLLSKTKYTRDIYKREDMIIGEFTLPMAFTVRESIGILINGGDVPAEPVMTISCTAVPEDPPEETGLEIKNKTTGEFLKLEYDIAAGETIIIDTKQYTITSSIAGNILHKMDERSTFFRLQIGTNAIEALDYSSGKAISMTIEYYERFVGV